ncbi:type VII secretion system-associated protein [Streptomyces sp. NPDC056716]|uniref:type VII secretion system-associated protein n=1 Tax=unclassified Streptomyces TaxID=2593676 RepID=UPI0036BD4735
MPDLTYLDSASLNTFLQNDVKDFIADLVAIRADDPSGVPAVKSLVEGKQYPETLQQNPLLAIGLMGGSDEVHGQSLLAVVGSAAGSVDGILAFQQQLFDEISDDLQKTIDTLLTTQGTSLEAIEGQELLDIFSDVDGLMANGATGTTTGTTTGGLTAA